MTNLTERLKDYAIGGFVPGTIAHQQARATVWSKILREVESGERSSAETNDSDKAFYHFASVFSLIPDMLTYGAALSVVMPEISKGNYGFAAAYVGMMTLARGHFYHRFKGHADRFRGEIADRLNKAEDN